MNKKVFSTRSKNILLFAVTGIILCVILVFLNSIDYSSYFGGTKEYVTERLDNSDVTYSDIYFEDPAVYSSEYKDAYELGKDALELNDNVSGKNEKISAFFESYFAALKNGDADSYNALFTEDYRENFDIKSAFSAQKIYNAEVSIITAVYIGSGGVENKYIYEISYRIYENDGSFRRDILGNEACIDRAEILESDNGVLSVNRLGKKKYLSVTIRGDDADILYYCMPLVWLFMFFAGAVAEIITKKLYALAVSLASLIAFTASALKAVPWLQILIFALFAAVLIISARWYKKRKKSAQTKISPDSDSTVTPDDNRNNDITDKNDNS